MRYMPHFSPDSHLTLQSGQQRSIKYTRHVSFVPEVLIQSAHGALDQKEKPYKLLCCLSEKHKILHSKQQCYGHCSGIVFTSFAVKKTRLFVCLFVRSFVCFSFVCSFVRSFICSFVRSIVFTFSLPLPFPTLSPISLPLLFPYPFLTFVFRPHLTPKVQFLFVSAVSDLVRSGSC